MLFFVIIFVLENIECRYFDITCTYWKGKSMVQIKKFVQACTLCFLEERLHENSNFM